DTENLFGLDFLWTHQQMEWTGEFLYRIDPQDSSSNEWGLFVQGVIPLSKRIFAVGRYEFFEPQGSLPGVHLSVGELAFSPLPPRVLRSEYLFPRDNVAKVPEGFAASLALLF